MTFFDWRPDGQRKKYSSAYLSGRSFDFAIKGIDIQPGRPTEGSNPAEVF
jgi:hypothetical protein